MRWRTFISTLKVLGIFYCNVLVFTTNSIFVYKRCMARNCMLSYYFKKLNKYCLLKQIIKDYFSDSIYQCLDCILRKKETLLQIMLFSSVLLFPAVLGAGGLWPVHLCFVREQSCLSSSCLLWMSKYSSLSVAAHQFAHWNQFQFRPFFLDTKHSYCKSVHSELPWCRIQYGK